MAAYACQCLSKFAEADEYYKHYLHMDRAGINAEIAMRAESIIENNILGQPAGDYFADATKERIVRWPQDQMPLKVFIEDDSSVPGYKPEFSTALKDAFGQWSDASEGKIKFVFTGTESDAQIVCSWTGDKLRLGGTKELGLTHVESQGDTIIFAKIDLYTLKDKSELRFDELVAAAKQVELHEIGHALGLEHSQQPYDVMYFETTPEGLEFPLTMRDKNTILALYSKFPSEIAHLPRSNTYSSSSSSSVIGKTAIRFQDEVPDLK